MYVYVCVCSPNSSQLSDASDARPRPHLPACLRPHAPLRAAVLRRARAPAATRGAAGQVMLTIQPGEHGSTYGGNPLGSAVAIAALEARGSRQ